MTPEQDILKQFYDKREELRLSVEQLRLQLQQHTELQLRVEGALEAFQLIGVELPKTES